MKYLFILLISTISLQITAQNLKPYCLAFESNDGLDATKKIIKDNLETAGLDILGEYQPAKDKSRWLIVIGSKELNNAVTKVGGLTGFALAQRVALTLEGDKIQVSHTNPIYWGNAYFREDFGKVKSDYAAFEAKLKKAMQSSGTYIGSYFGSKKGVELDDLREYQYMFGMPDFEDTEELAEFESFNAAVAKVEANFALVKNVKKVYSIKLPGKDIQLYGVALMGKNGESSFLPTIDISKPKHTAFLPYEFLVIGKEVHMLTGRYRIALAFPDLTMGTFTRIISAPGNIEDDIKQLVE